MKKAAGLFFIVCIVFAAIGFYRSKSGARIGEQQFKKDGAKVLKEKAAPAFDDMNNQKADPDLTERPSAETGDSLPEDALSDMDPQAALEAILHAADNGQPEIFDKFSFMDGVCSRCDALYADLFLIITDRNQSMQRRFFAAEILSRAGNLRSVGYLLEALEKDPEGESSELYMEAIARAAADRDVIEHADKLLKSSIHTRIRQCLTAMLGYQHSLRAAEILYNDLIRNPESQGFAGMGIGLVVFQAGGEALPFLEDKAGKADKYSPFALSALLQSGKEGIDRAVSLLKEIENEEILDSLLDKTGSIISWRNPGSLQYLRNKAESEENAKLRNFLLSLER